MSFSIKKYIHYSLFKGISSLVLIGVFITSNMVPQTVEAKGNFLSNSIDFLLGRNTEEVNAVTDVSLSFPENEESPRMVIWAVMTAYSSDVAQTDSTPCIPADSSFNLCVNYEELGLQDTIAANFLPLGTKVKFPELYGDKVFTVRDRMNARYGYARGDIWMPSYPEAKQFGVKKVKMEIFYR
ncbi:MAG: hypothetical protein WCW16_02325 [Candidatus Magasanikbacteria bacterium]